MTSLPVISVVVPSFNQGRFLAECLDSILVQAYPALELIVMDGGSSDESVEIIRQYENRLTYWQSEPDGGQSAAINAGVTRARGDLVAWLNSDDLYYKDALWAVARAWIAFAGRGLYIGNGFRLNDETKQLTRHNNRHMAFARNALREGLDYILQPSAFFNLADWRAVGGLDERLQFCMDWDIFIRLADRNAVVMTNDFLGVSREYEDTKTSSGGFRRVDELVRMVKSHTGRDLTIGGSIYGIWTLLGEPMGEDGDVVRHHLDQARYAAQQRLASLGASLDGSPDSSDAGDVTYLPFADAEMPRPPVPEGFALPLITVVVPVLDQADHLERALKSVIGQNYPRLETVVVDRGSTDGSVAIIERLASGLSHWETALNSGPADAINRGLARGTGEVLVWLGPDDMMADGALHAIGIAFAADEQLDFGYGDAVRIDDLDQPVIVGEGGDKTSLRVGAVQERNRIPAYWSYRYSDSQPAMFFRRRVIDRIGGLAGQYRTIFDIEFLFRGADGAAVRQLDRVLTFERVRDGRKADAAARSLVELYEFSRAWWPDRKSPAFTQTRDHFLTVFMERYRQGGSTAVGRWVRRRLLSLLVTHRLANPERMFPGPRIGRGTS